MVCTLSSGFSVRLGVAPAAIVTIMVSPIARESARMNEARIPDSAAGTTVRVETSSLVAPSAYAASRSESGTALIASSASDETIGMIMMPTTMLALAALNTCVCGQTARSIGVMNVSAK